MYRKSGCTSTPLILPLALGLVTWPVGTAAAAPCPTAGDIQTTIGFPVKAHPQVADRCMYQLTGQYQGAFVTVIYQPATRAEELYADITKRVKGAKGANAQPDRLTIGEGGLGYGSRGRKEAAAVAKGQLYHVEVDYDLMEDDLKLRDDVAIRLIELAMRSTPAGNSTAAFDACLLATNAELSEIAEEDPAIAKHWSAPEASSGGTNCQYDGGSIRVYRGKRAGDAVESMLKAVKADKLPRVPVDGIGDKAFFIIPKPNDEYNRFGMLAVYDGPRVLQLILDAQRDESIEATKPRLARLARLVLPRLAEQP